ncbi:MAG: hypothetical protein AB8B94_12265 [Hyphomicrobiales bacterium]
MPQFTSIAIEQLDETLGTKFQSPYGENRLLELVQYRLVLIEEPAGDPEPVRALFADGFSLNFSTGTISYLDGYKLWLVGPASQLVASTRVLNNISDKQLDDV